MNRQIVKATTQDLNTVKYIVYETIKNIYPNYYPTEIVTFFLNYHDEESILADLNKGTIFLLSENGKFIGTGTINEDHINRVYVLPDFQGKGFGSQIMTLLEDQIGLNYDGIYLDSSLPAFRMYTKRGYYPVEYQEESINDQILCYHIMKKDVTRKSISEVNLNGS